MSFFSAFSYTSPVMPIIDKKSQFCHNHGLLWTKKTKRCLFSLFLMKKSLLFSPYFFKNGPFSKKHIALTPIFYQKNLHSLKTRYSLVIFFQNFRELPPPIMQTIGKKKRKFCQNYTLF